MKMLIASFTLLLASSAFADFIGCWDTTQLGIVKQNKNWIIDRGPSNSLWLTSKKQTTSSVLNFASLSPVKGWMICLEGDMKNSDVNVSEALICTSDETVGICDPQSKIADSRLF